MREIRLEIVPRAEWPEGLRALPGAGLSGGSGAAGVSPNSGFASAGPFPLEGMLYLIRGEEAYRCADSPEGEILLSALAAEKTSPFPETAEEALAILLKGCSRERMHSLLREFGISAPAKSCVTVLRCDHPTGGDLCATLRDLAPMEEGDLLIPCGRGTIAMIRQGDDLEEITEFTQALLDTAEEEAALRLRAGIGDPHNGPEDWPRGFREATEALRLGEEFHLSGDVQTYRSQLLARILREIPAEKRKAARQIVFNEQTEKALGPEVMETAERFLESDLNLSDTARQMFIHRNTLTYRLDKIRKETGLDLRRFGDAVVFRVLSALPEDVG